MMEQSPLGSQKAKAITTPVDETKSPQEPKNTRSRNWLAMRLKSVRSLPFEKMGQKQLSQKAINRTGMERASIGESSLEFREVQMGVDFVREIKRILEKKKEEGKGNDPVRVLDVGAAKSTFLSQLKKRFGRQLEAHSVDVRFFPPEDHPQKRGIDQHVFHVEALSKVLPENYFDMIVDCRGGVLYAQDREKALEEIYTVLSPGSSSYIFPKPRSGLKNIFNSDWIQKWADQAGAKIVLSKNEKTNAGRTLKITKPEEGAHAN